LCTANFPDSGYSMTSWGAIVQRQVPQVGLRRVHDLMRILHAAGHVNEEMAFILEGTGTLRAGDREFPIRAGDVISSPGCCSRRTAGSPLSRTTHRSGSGGHGQAEGRRRGGAAASRDLTYKDVGQPVASRLPAGAV
jgi:hypothetical protein